MIYLKGLIHAVMCFLVITLLALQSSEKNTSHLQWLGSLPEHPTIFCGHRLVEWTTGWIKAEDWHKIAAYHRHGPVWHNLTEQSTDCQQVHIYIFTPYNPGVFVGFFIQSAHLNWQKKIVNTQHLKTERKKKKTTARPAASSWYNHPFYGTNDMIPVLAKYCQQCHCEESADDMKTALHHRSNELCNSRNAH